MPLKKAKPRASKKEKQAVASKNISEFHKGDMYKKTKEEHGEEVARKQAIAVGLIAAGLSRKSNKNRD